MSIRNFFLYLFGSRQAILALAADRRAVWVGLVFVLSAGFAREYDGKDLLREPWHLLVPLAASLVASYLLFLVTCGLLFLREENRLPFWSAYRSFLTLFWWTAPLAWLYAVPYERFLPAGEATRANLWTLALVAAWRVLLMTRVVSVLTGRGVAASFFLVMVFADVVAVVAAYLMPTPIVSIMGGVRLTESEIAVKTATDWVIGLGCVTAPVWVIGAFIALINGKPDWLVKTTSRSSGWAVWGLAVASLLVWAPILPLTQREQQLRSRVEEAMRGGRISNGLDVMSAHSISDFPPHWDPPPRVGYGEETPSLGDVLDLIKKRNDAAWVRDIYFGKVR